MGWLSDDTATHLYPCMQDKKIIRVSGAPLFEHTCVRAQNLAKFIAASAVKWMSGILPFRSFLQPRPFCSMCVEIVGKVEPDCSVSYVRPAEPLPHRWRRSGGRHFARARSRRSARRFAITRDARAACFHATRLPFTDRSLLLDPAWSAALRPRQLRCNGASCREPPISQAHDSMSARRCAMRCKRERAPPLLRGAAERSPPSALLCRVEVFFYAATAFPSRAHYLSYTLHVSILLLIKLRPQLFSY